MTAGQFLTQWLRGSTCSRHMRSVVWQSGSFVLLKHHGHSEWVGGFSPSSWCETYYALYDLRAKPPDCLGNPCIKRWPGRWTAARQEECELLAREQTLDNAAQLVRRFKLIERGASPDGHGECDRCSSIRNLWADPTEERFKYCKGCWASVAESARAKLERAAK